MTTETKTAETLTTEQKAERTGAAIDESMERDCIVHLAASEADVGMLCAVCEDHVDETDFWGSGDAGQWRVIIDR